MYLVWFLSIFMFAAVSAQSYNHPSINVNVVAKDLDDSHLKASHQLSYVTLQDQVVIINGLYKAHLKNSHHFEGGLGLRQFSDDFGVGLNLFYNSSNNSGVFGHQLVMGNEFFHNRFQYSFNHYYPLVRERNLNDNLIKFPTISEFGFTYRPSKKYEFGILPFYNHSLEKWGVNGRASAFLTNTIELEMTPFIRPSNKGISFSIGFHFGGPKPLKLQSIRKSHEFVFMGPAKSKPIQRSPIAPVVNIPTIQKPEQVPAPSVIKTGINPIEIIPNLADQPTAIPPENPPKPRRLWDFFFNGSGRNS